MPLNIKDEAVHAKARRLAELTGRSITAAVSEAIDHRLAEVEDAREPEIRRRSERLLALGRAVAATLPRGHGATSTDHDELLYDEDGLPK
jgi:antitoxin VapB